MIYVILCPAFKSSEDEFEKLLKIGYTEDSKKDRRFYQYKAHNPTIKVLYEISNGTLELENLIHSYFNKYKYGDFGKEWFIWDEEIIQFFETYKTVDDLLTILDSDYIRRCPKKRFNGFVKFSYAVIDKCLNLKMKLCNDFTMDQALDSREQCYNELDKSGLIIKNGVIKYIINYFDLTMDQYQDFTDLTKLSNTVSKFIQDFNNLPGFYDKMKAICESDFSENERFMILEQVPILYKNLYLQMGPERLKANSYNITFIKKELYNNNIVENNNQDICSLFLQYFKIGEKYLLSDIKNTIKQIYVTVGLECKPKAIEIEKYFEVRKIQVTNKETGKKDHGYEILKIKSAT